MSVGTAVKVFNMKFLPMLSYGLDRVWKHLTVENFRSLEPCFCTFMKRVLSLHKSTKNRFVYLLADCPPSVEVMRQRLRILPTISFTEFVDSIREKNSAVVAEVGDLNILSNRSLWAECARGDR